MKLSRFIGISILEKGRESTDTGRFNKRSLDTRIQAAKHHLVRIFSDKFSQSHITAVRILLGHHARHAFGGKPKVKTDGSRLPFIKQSQGSISEKGSIPRSLTHPVHLQGARIKININQFGHPWNRRTIRQLNFILRLAIAGLRNLSSKLQPPIHRFCF